MAHSSIREFSCSSLPSLCIYFCGHASGLNLHQIPHQTPIKSKWIHVSDVGFLSEVGTLLDNVAIEEKIQCSYFCIFPLYLKLSWCLFIKCMTKVPKPCAYTSGMNSWRSYAVICQVTDWKQQSCINDWIKRGSGLFLGQEFQIWRLQRTALRKIHPKWCW